MLSCAVAQCVGRPLSFNCTISIPIPCVLSASLQCVYEWCFLFVTTAIGQIMYFQQMGMDANHTCTKASYVNKGHLLDVVLADKVMCRLLAYEEYVRCVYKHSLVSAGVTHVVSRVP